MTTDRSRRRRRLASIFSAAIALSVCALWALLWLEPGLALDAWRETSLVASGAETGEVVVDGERIAWASVGRGRPALVVHGLRGELTVELPLARALARRGYRAVAIDLPGHGRSAPPSRPLDIDRASRLVLGAAEALELGERPVIVGHSLGGWIVAWAMLREPERCGPVVLVSSAGLPFELPPMRLLLSRTASDARRALPLLFAKPPAFVPQPLLWIAVQRSHAASLDLLRSALTGHHMLDGLLEAAAVPVLVVFGEQDRLIPPEVGRALARAAPGHRYIGIEGAGHMVVWEEPERVAGAIARFADDVSDPPTPPSLPQRAAGGQDRAD